MTLTLEIVKYILSGFGLLVPLKNSTSLNDQVNLTTKTLTFEDDQVSEIFNISSKLSENLINITFSNISGDSETKSLLVMISLDNDYSYSIYIDFTEKFYNPLILFKTKTSMWQVANILIQSNCLSLVENLRNLNFVPQELSEENYKTFKNCVEYIENYLET